MEMDYCQIWFYLLCWLCSVHSYLGATTVVPSDVTVEQKGVNVDAAPMAVITIAIVAGAILIGVGIAKLFDFIHDRRALRDDASDISEFTKNILRARFVMAFKEKSEEKKTAEELARKAAHIWAERAAKSREKRLSMKPEGNDALGALHERLSSVDLHDVPLPPEDPMVVIHEGRDDKTGKSMLANLGTQNASPEAQDELPTKVSIEDKPSLSRLSSKAGYDNKSNHNRIDTGANSFDNQTPSTDQADSQTAKAQGKEEVTVVEPFKGKDVQMDSPKMKQGGDVAGEGTWARREARPKSGRSPRPHSGVTAKPTQARPHTSADVTKPTMTSNRPVKTAVTRKTSLSKGNKL